jgi:hypothetical protein
MRGSPFSTALDRAPAQDPLGEQVETEPLNDDREYDGGIGRGKERRPREKSGSENASATETANGGSTGSRPRPDAAAEHSGLAAQPTTSSRASMAPGRGSTAPALSRG